MRQTLPISDINFILFALVLFCLLPCFHLLSSEQHVSHFNPCHFISWTNLVALSKLLDTPPEFKGSPLSIYYIKALEEFCKDHTWITEDTTISNAIEYISQCSDLDNIFKLKFIVKEVGVGLNETELFSFLCKVLSLKDEHVVSLLAFAFLREGAVNLLPITKESIEIFRSLYPEKYEDIQEDKTMETLFSKLPFPSKEFIFKERRFASYILYYLHRSKPGFAKEVLLKSILRGNPKERREELSKVPKSMYDGNSMKR